MEIRRIIVATRNLHKSSEIAAMLGNSLHVSTLRDLINPPEVIEDQMTFTRNATKKAVTLAEWLANQNPQTPDATTGGVFILADDSGLEVDALQGAPGVYSARFAAPPGHPGNSPDSENNAKLLQLLHNQPRPWTARFRCVLALTPLPSAAPQNFSTTCLLTEAEVATRIFEGACEGQIIPEAKGAHGFGYDPLFVPNGFSQSFAELGEETKNEISHRAAAMKKLRAAIFGT
jgi:XTP/dITP diphosphohydrolase